jgi:hypothetical protein
MTEPEKAPAPALDPGLLIGQKGKRKSGTWTTLSIDQATSVGLWRHGHKATWRNPA